MVPAVLVCLVAAIELVYLVAAVVVIVVRSWLLSWAGGVVGGVLIVWGAVWAVGEMRRRRKARNTAWAHDRE